MCIRDRDTNKDVEKMRPESDIRKRISGLGYSLAETEIEEEKTIEAMKTAPEGTAVHSLLSHKYKMNQEYQKRLEAKIKALIWVLNEVTPSTAELVAAKYERL